MPVPYIVSTRPTMDLVFVYARCHRAGYESCHVSGDMPSHRWLHGPWGVGPVQVQWCRQEKQCTGVVLCNMVVVKRNSKSILSLKN
jgi:hypothetical protein